jgi:hypothetical protein
MNPWDQRFAADDYVFGTEPAKALLKLETSLVPGGKTLVVADGEGRNSVYLASKGFEDISPPIIYRYRSFKLIFRI